MQGPGPGPRYGHVMALVGQRYLMAIGGNDGEHFNVLTLANGNLLSFIFFKCKRYEYMLICSKFKD